MSQFKPLSAVPLEHFLDDLASGEPVPGGGSVAALSGALAASLLSMVCRLTIGKSGYEEVEPEMRVLLARSEELGRELRDLMQTDIDAYGRVMQAYRHPKATEQDKNRRTAAIQEALKYASSVPLHVAELCSTLVELSSAVAEKGNKNAASDAGVGALMAEAGLRGAALNVAINLATIKDAAFVSSHRTKIADLTARAAERKQQILRGIEDKL